MRFIEVSISAISSRENVRTVPVDPGHREHGGFHRRRVARDDGLQRDRDVRCDHHRIDAGLRPRAVRALAGDANVEEGAARHHRTGAHRELPQRQARPVVHAENGIARKFLEQAVLDHGLGAAQALLGRLEDEMHAAVEVARLGQVARRAEQHGGVPVVAAGVHLPRARGTVRERVAFRDRQRVHVGAQPERALARACAQRADHAGPAQAAMHLAAECGELRGDQVRGAGFLEAEFGMRVDVAPPSGEFGVHAGDTVNDGHGAVFSSWCCGYRTSQASAPFAVNPP
jgi:hypothetical protein